MGSNGLRKKVNPCESAEMKGKNKGLPWQKPAILSIEPLEAAALGGCDGSGGFGKSVASGCNPATLGS